MKEELPHKYVIYARRSMERRDKEERVNSIEDQLGAMRQVADDMKIKVVKEFTEAHSAKTPGGRLQFSAMLAYIRSGKANAILCWNYDRLTRNPEEDGQLQQLLLDGAIMEIKTPTKVYKSADNLIVVSVEGAMSAEYIRKLIENITRGLYSAAARGFRPSIAPLGYRNSKYREQGMQEEILVDEPNFRLLRKMFDYVLTNQYTPFQVLKMAQDEWGFRSRKTRRYPNGKLLSKTGWYNILTNTFYYGEYEYPAGSGNVYKGNHKPLITRAEFDEIQKILGKDGPKPRIHAHAYVGLMRCGECGARITCENKTKRQKNGNVHNYIYYRCTAQIDPDCTQKCTRIDKLEEQIVSFLSSIKISPTFHQWAIEELRKEYDRERDDKTAILYSQHREYEKIKEQLEQIYQMRLGGEIDSEKYKEEKKRLGEEERRIKGYLDSVDERIQNWIYDAERVLTFAERASEEFQKGDMEKKRAILAALGTEHVLKDRQLTIHTEKPLLVVQEMVFRAEKRGKGLEPPLFLTAYDPNGRKLSTVTVMWRWAELNRRAMELQLELLRGLVRFNFL